MCCFQSDLTNLRDQLKAGLSSRVSEGEAKEGPSTPELAEKIKALKAANTLEASTPRDPRKVSTAEEPITAQIRRRQEASAATLEEGVTREAALEWKEDSKETLPMTFQERILRERGEIDDSQSPA
jgi:hypothetical protein